MSKQEQIKDSITTLNLINYQIAELSRIKEELESRLNALLEHPDEGQKTYVFEKHKVQITSGYNYSLDKEEYEVASNNIRQEFNPVKKKTVYELDKTVIRNAEKYASQEDLMLMSSFITKKPKKLHIKIYAGV